MTIFDDPNREAVGLEPIWTGAGEAPPEGDLLDDEPKAKAKSSSPKAKKDDVEE